MPRYRVLPYRQGSRSARALADALPNGRVLRLRGSTFVPRRGDVIINWGNTEGINIPRAAGVRIVDYLNPQEDIRDASNKLRFFNLMVEAGLDDIIPEFWETRREIPREVFDNGGKVVCRQTLAGHSGEGIVIAENENQLVQAPLYTKYIPKQQEWRIHVGIVGIGQSIIISRQRKARRQDVHDRDVNWQVRNLAGGFVFVRNDGTEPPHQVLEVARLALEASGLDFGAVDVIYNERRERAYVLEINTAPGLEGQTITDYAAFFTRR